MKLFHALAAPLLTLLLGGLLTFWLVHGAPGYDTDAAELDGRRSAASVAAIRARNRNTLPVWQSYPPYVAGILHGDFGTSRRWNLPVSRLLAERGAVTLRSAGSGLLFGWMAAVTLGMAGSCRGFSWMASIGRGSAASLLCLPAPALALGLCLWLRRTDPEARAAIAVALVVFARVLLAAAAVIASAQAEPHVLHARARGVSGMRLAIRHVLHRAAPALAALLAVSLPLGFSVAVPVEMVCNLAGAGQLAWLAAEQRDLPVLAGLTSVLLAFTLCSSAVARAAAPGTAALAERSSR